MTLSESALLREAAATGFQPESLEKVHRLLELLNGFRSHPFLKSRIALKGGTALNLFVFNVPRLSVDLDLNYIGAVDRQAMLDERLKIEKAVEDVCGRLGISIRRAPSEHAGGKWRMSYMTAFGRSGALELDINFMLRSPLWPPVVSNSNQVGAVSATNVSLMDIHEIAAGKLAALFSRNASRDLFDVRELFHKKELEQAKIRLAFVIYGGFNRRDWREICIDDVKADPVDVDRKLLPMLRADIAPARDQIEKWSEKLQTECRERLSVILSLTSDEVEFLTRLNDRGVISPELLTEDDHLRQVIRSHPGLQWKAINVRKFRGLPEKEESR